MNYVEAMDIIGGLSQPSKMPWYSYSTSALDCQTGSKLREVQGSVCSDCYACKGCYVFKAVKNAHQRRLEAISNPLWVEAFIIVLTTLYNRGRKTYLLNGKETKENRFRWHDSGDLQSLEHLQKIVAICEATPFLIHWIPTKEHGYVSQYLKSEGAFPDNLIVRLSATMIGQTYSKRPQGLPFSTVNANSNNLEQCSAPNQDGKCNDCNACWDKTKDVNYNLH